MKMKVFLASAATAACVTAGAALPAQADVSPAGALNAFGPAVSHNATNAAVYAAVRRASPARRPRRPGGFVTRTAKSSIGLKQLVHTAVVYMKRASISCGNGNECGIHKLAATGNMNLPVQAWLTCASGKTVNKLNVKVVGKAKVYAVSGNTTKQSVSKKINIQPWTARQFEKACQNAFGGAWVMPNLPKVNKKSTSTTMKAIATVYGHCSGAPQGTSKAVNLKLNVTCVDKSYFAPVP